MSPDASDDVEAVVVAAAVVELAAEEDDAAVEVAVLGCVLTAVV